MSVHVTNLADFRARRERELIRDYMGGSYRPRRHLTLSESLGRLSVPPIGGAA